MLLDSIDKGCNDTSYSIYMGHNDKHGSNALGFCMDYDMDCDMVIYRGFLVDCRYDVGYKCELDLLLVQDYHFVMEKYYV